MKTIKNIAFFAAVLLSITACEKILEFEPEGSSLEEADALATDDDVLKFLNGVYDVTANFLGGRAQGLADVMGDDVRAPQGNNDLMEVYNHHTTFFNTSTNGFYGNPYFGIFRANRIIEILDDYSFSASEQLRIDGECKFLRALSHQKIMELYAQPPGFTADNSHLGIVYKTNSISGLEGRGTLAENLGLLLSDINDAITQLPEENGVYATKDAARALKAKVLFQMGDYQNAADVVTTIINTAKYSLGNDLDRFLSGANSSEAIWSVISFVDGPLIDARSGVFTGNYRFFNNSIPLFRATTEFYNIYVADTADKRIIQFFEVQGIAPDEEVICKKFDKDYFNVPVFHLTDMKLLRAEALAEAGGDLSMAIQDVNDIKERAYGHSSNNLAAGASASEIISAARYERRIEMFGEGDRITQLKRWGAIEKENVFVRIDPWNCNGMILQFPISEKSTVFEMNPSGGCN